MSTVLLTGATGFLGSHLLTALLANRYNVVVLKRSTSDLWRINELVDQVTFYDIDQVPVERAFSENKIDAVIHTACQYGRNNESISEIVNSNLMFGLEVLEAAIKNKTNLFVNTDSFLNKDINNYSFSKKQFVEWLSRYSGDINVANLKIEHMYGPKDDTNKFVSWIISEFRKNSPEIRLTKGTQLRDFVYIDDVVSAYLCVLANSQQIDGFQEFEVGTGVSISVKEFLTKLKSAYEKNISRTDARMNFGVIPYRDAEVMSVAVNNSGLKKLGWEPKTLLDEGIEYTLRDK